MYTKRENLEAIFRMIDLDSNGLISVDEFKQACEMLSSKSEFCNENIFSQDNQYDTMSFSLSKQQAICLIATSTKCWKIVA